MSPIEYSVVEINQLTSTHIQLWISPINDILQYESGQYLKIRYPNNEFMPFSMANAPDPSGRIELHIRVEHDLDTLAFLRPLKKFSKIVVLGPYGHCIYRKDNINSLIILAAGTGFAPAKAIIEKIIETKDTEEINLYWTVKKTENFYLPKLPLEWQKTLHNFFYTPIVTQIEQDISDKKIKILDAVLSDFVTLLSSKVYVFGPHSLALQASKLFIENGLDERNFYTDMLV